MTMSDDIRSFTCYSITLTHNGARVDGEYRMTHRRTLDFMNATNESTGIGIRYALTKKEAEKMVDEYNQANGFGFVDGMRFFNVAFVHDLTVYNSTISSADTIVRGNTDITEERAINSIRKAASKQVAQHLGVEDIDAVAFNIRTFSNEITIEEVMTE